MVPLPIWRGQDRINLEVLADYARVADVEGHELPRSGLAGVGANLSVALTKHAGRRLRLRYRCAARPWFRRAGGHHAVRIQVRSRTTPGPSPPVSGSASRTGAAP